MSGYILAERGAVLKDRTTNYWTNHTNISSWKIANLFDKYRAIELPVIDAFGNEQTLDLYKHECECRSLNMTVQEWLDSIKDQALKTTEGFPELNIALVGYQAGAEPKGTYTLTKRGYHPSHDVALEDLDDLIVSWEGYDYLSLHKHSLWSIGGFYMPSMYHDYGIRIKNAGDIVRKSADLKFGMTDFRKVGEVKQVPVTPAMISKIGNRSYREAIVIDTGEDLTGKTVGLVLGGYLHLCDGTIKIIGQQTVTAKLNGVNIVERVNASIRHLDLPFMELDGMDVNSIVAKIRDDNNMLEYLTCPYSFLVIIDNAEIAKKTASPTTNTFPGYSVQPETWPMAPVVDQLGKLIEYWPITEDGQTVLCSNDTHLPTYAIDDTNWHKLTRVNDAAIGIQAEMDVRPSAVYYVARVSS